MDTLNEVRKATPEQVAEFESLLGFLNVAQTCQKHGLEGPAWDLYELVAGYAIVREIPHIPQLTGYFCTQLYPDGAVVEQKRDTSPQRKADIFYSIGIQKEEEARHLLSQDKGGMAYNPFCEAEIAFKWALDIGMPQERQAEIGDRLRNIGENIAYLKRELPLRGLRALSQDMKGELDNLEQKMYC